MSFYVEALRRRWFLVALILLVGTAGSAAFALTSQPRFQAEAQLFVGTTAKSTDSAGLNQSGQFAQQRVKSYVKLVTTPRVLEPVLRRLGTRESLESFSQKVEASAPVDTVLLDVRVTDTNPRYARTAANAIAEQFARVAPAIEKSTSDAVPPVSVTLVSPATTPRSPSGQSALTVTALGASMGLAVGLALAFLLQALRPGYSTDEELESRLGLKVVGSLQGVRNGHPSRSPGTEMLTAQIAAQLEPGRVSVIAMTDLDPEGSSSALACSIADSFVRRDRKVALIDADADLGNVAQLIEIRPVYSLAHFLDDADLDLGHGGSQLILIGSGAAESDKPRVDRSIAIQSRLEALRDAVDLVLISAPRVIQSADALVWASLADFTLVQFSRGRRRAVVDSAVESLRVVGAHILGVVLNSRIGRGSRGRRELEGGVLE